MLSLGQLFFMTFKLRTVFSFLNGYILNSYISACTIISTLPPGQQSLKYLLSCPLGKSLNISTAELQLFLYRHAIDGEEHSTFKISMLLLWPLFSKPLPFMLHFSPPNANRLIFNQTFKNANSQVWWTMIVISPWRWGWKVRN